MLEQPAEGEAAEGEVAGVRVVEVVQVVAQAVERAQPDPGERAEARAEAAAGATPTSVSASTSDATSTSTSAAAAAAAASVRHGAAAATERG